MPPNGSSLGLLSVTLVVAVCLLVLRSTTDAPDDAGVPLTPRYTLTIPDPSARIAHVRCDIDGVTSPTLTLAFLYRAAPGLDPTVEAYRIVPRMWRRGFGGGEDVVPAARRDVPIRLEANPGGNTHLIHVGPVAGGQDLGDISMEYDLDLVSALGSATDTDTASRIYQDRMIVTDSFATLRGDVLPVPVGHPVRNPHVRVVAPSGWETILNAEARPDGYVSENTYPAEAATRSLRWSGVAGKGLRQQVQLVDGVGWRLVMAPSRTDPRVLGRMTWDRVGHAATTFGIEPLKHLGLAPPLGIGRAELVIFALPFPDRFSFGVGGQYQLGTALFFYAPDDIVDLGHIIAHEYLHAYNNAAFSPASLGPDSVSEVTWFTEGYTDVEATLTNLGLELQDDAQRLQRLRTAIVESWASAYDRDAAPLVAQLVARPLTDAARHPEHRVRPRRSVNTEGSASLAPDQGAMWRDAHAYVRNVQGRGALLAFGLAILLERARPGRAGFDAWMQIMLRDHAITAAVSTGIDRLAIEQACLEAAGDRAGAVATFFARHVTGVEPISLDQLRSWLDDPALLTLCPRLPRGRTDRMSRERDLRGHTD